MNDLEFEGREKILGLPIGKKFKKTIKGEGYKYSIIGKEAKDYAIQKQSTSSEVPPVTEGGQNLQENGARVGQGEQGTQAPQEVPIQEPTAAINQEEVNTLGFAKLLNNKAKVIKSVTGERAVNYVNKDGIEVSIAEDDGGVINGEDTQADIMIDYIGNSIPKNRGKGLATNELNKIISEANKNNKSLSVLVDSKTATEGGGTIGLNNEQLKKWYQSKGFIFNEDGLYGYRPKKSEDASIYLPKNERKIFINGESFLDNPNLTNKFRRLAENKDLLVSVNTKEELISEINNEFNKRQISKNDRDALLNELNNVKEFDVKEIIPKTTEAPQEFISEKVSRLREQEQAEYAAMKNPNDAVKRAEIYNRYDKPITEAIREAKEKVTVKVEDIQLPELNDENLDIAIESATDIADLNKKAKRVTSKAAKNSISKKIKESEAELASLPVEGKIAKGISDNFDAIKKELKDKGLIETKGC